MIPESINPSIEVLIKLGSIVVHLEEALSNKGHSFDAVIIKHLLEDSELKKWLAEMDKLAFLPIKR